MSWLLIKLSVARAQVDTVAEALEAAGALSVTIQGDADEHRLQRALEHVPLWTENRVVGLFPEQADATVALTAIRDALGRADPPPHEVAFLADQDWGRAWQAHYRPIQITPALWVCPSWCTPPDPTAVNLLLDPGLAFGTGTHPTTALCLRWLAQQPLAGRTVIDYGCGSGILAIAALKLGAASAIGVDVDVQALEASRDNAARNGVGGRFRAVRPAELSADAGADIVAANILAGTLIELRPELVRHLHADGQLCLSGLLNTQAAEVRLHYEPGFALQCYEADGWALLAGSRGS